MEDQQHLAMRQQPFSQKQRCTHMHTINVKYVLSITIQQEQLKYNFPISHFLSTFCFIRLKPVHKVEGMTNGTAAAAGQQLQQQQGSGHVDISTQVQQYQQFLGEQTPLSIIVVTRRV